jgi:protein-S-isoprenylcysteine O-methyltransferase Ste14
MASQLATPSTFSDAPPPTAAGRFTRLCVRRRVPISLGILAVLLWLDGWVFHGGPRNVTSWADPLVAVGEMIIFAGLFVRSWAAGTLKKQKQLATTGPYALVRHPLYFGSILMMAGFACLGFHPYSLLVVSPPLIWLYWVSIQSEERHVSKLFPLEWPGYTAKVPAFVPRRIVIPRLADWSLAQWLKNSEYQAILGAILGLALVRFYYFWLY